MVTNTELTIDMITYEALIVLKNEMGLGNRCMRQFDSSFGEAGAKIGDNLRVRVPIRVVSTTGAAPAAQNFTETYRTLAVQTQRNVLLEFTTKDLALAIDDFSERAIRPSVRQLSNDIDTDGTSTFAGGYVVTNSGYVTSNYAGTFAGFESLATPGTISGVTGPAAWTGIDLGSGASAANTAVKPFLDAQARLDEQSAPRQSRYGILSPAADAATVQNLLNLFNPSREIDEAYEAGRIGNLAGATFYRSQNIPLFTSGVWTNNANVAVTSANGDTTLAVGRAGNANTFNVGDQFVVAGVGSVNPLTRLSTGKLQVFTIINAGGVSSNAGGNVTLNVFPTISINGQYQTVNSLPSVGSNVTFQGTPATSTQVNVMYQKDAIALVVAPLASDLPGAEVSSSRADDEEGGMSIRYVQQYQALTDQVVRRLDILYGWGVVRPELGCRIQA
jgi:P22 coat protein - gene protein 5